MLQVYLCVQLMNLQNKCLQIYILAAHKPSRPKSSLLVFWLVNVFKLYNMSLTSLAQTEHNQAFIKSNTKLLTSA